MKRNTILNTLFKLAVMTTAFCLFTQALFERLSKALLMIGTMVRDGMNRKRVELNRKGPPGFPDGPKQSHHAIKPDASDQCVFVVVVVVFVVTDMVSFAMAPLSMVAPSVAVMLSVVVSTVSLPISVTVVSLVVSVFGWQAETISAAPPIIETAATLEMNARIGKLPRLVDLDGLETLIPKPWWTLVGLLAPLKPRFAGGKKEFQGTRGMQTQGLRQRLQGRPACRAPRRW
jgi:hypothetical protein